MIPVFSTLYPLWLLLMSSLSFFQFFLDKRFAAQRGRRRNRERTLLFCALIGGAPGAFLGMHLFRHKTQKKQFLIAIACFLLIHIGILLLFS